MNIRGKAVIVTSFDTYENRTDLLRKFFTAQGYSVEVLASSFSHFHKTVRTDRKAGYTYLPAVAYKKNISAARLYSHYRFSREVLAAAEARTPDILYILLPPNSLANAGRIYKARHTECVLALDVIDLWPETLPIRRFKEVFPLSIWKKMRTNAFASADVVLTECSMYKEFLEREAADRAHTLYMAHRETRQLSTVLRDDALEICFLGSINNITDIDAICAFLRGAAKKKRVVLHIIGDGESRERLVSEAQAYGADVKFYGMVFDEDFKQRVFARCRFGLNIMKESVCIGLTMKSVDYFAAGLPIINNIKGDTAELIERYSSGFALNAETADAILSQGTQEHLLMRARARKLFDEFFSERAFMDRLGGVFKGLLK